MQYASRDECELGIRHACLTAGVLVTDLAVALGLNPRALFNYTRYPLEPADGRKASLRQVADALFKLGNASVRFEPEDFLVAWGPRR